MGCTHSTYIPSDEEFGQAKHNKHGSFLLEHLQMPKQAETVYPSPNMEGSNGEVYTMRIQGSKILCKNHTAGVVQLDETALTVEFVKHFPGYSVALKSGDSLIAIMLPLYRPGRPTIKIYSPMPAYEGQEPSKSQSKKTYGEVYAWAEWRSRGASNNWFSIDWESADGKVPAYVAHRAGAKCSPWTELIVTSADNSKTPAAKLQHVDEFEWNVIVSPQGVDPVLMLCMALMTEQLAKTQQNATKMQSNPLLVFSM
jgi:hypothetical protein